MKRVALSLYHSSMSLNTNTILQVWINLDTPQNKPNTTPHITININQIPTNPITRSRIYQQVNTMNMVQLIIELVSKRMCRRLLRIRINIL